MAITTYAELQSAITNWMGGRTDLTSFYPDWITLFEAYAARRLRVRPMETAITLTLTNGAANLPADYLGFKQAYRSDAIAAPLEYKSDDYLLTLFPTYPSGISQFFSITQTNFKVYPQDSTSVVLIYYAKNTAVSSTLNWLFNNYPDAYLFGALLEGANFTADTDQAIIWKSRRDEIMDEVSKLNFREAGGLSIGTRGSTP